MTELNAWPLQLKAKMKDTVSGFQETGILLQGSSESQAANYNNKQQSRHQGEHKGKQPWIPALSSGIQT